MLCLLVKVHEDVVVSFPLYSEALKFAQHGEKMIQIAVRAITLNIFNVCDDMVYEFVTTPPVSEYFSDLVLNLRKQCFHLDTVVHATEKTCHERREQLLMETDKLVDDLYYFKDIISVGELRLSKMVTQYIFSILIFPILLPLLHLGQSSGAQLSAITSLFVVSRLLQVLEGTNVVNFVASAILCFYVSSSIKDGTEAVTTDGISQASSFVNNFCELAEMVCPEPEGAENFERNYLFEHLSDYMASSSHFFSFPPEDVHKEMGGILQYVFSDDHGLMLACLMLLVILAESKDIDYKLAGMIGFSRTNSRMQKTHDFSASQVAGSIIARYMHQILNALLKVLASEPPSSAKVQWHTGWILRKLLVFQEKKLNDFDFQLFNKSYEKSCKRLHKELHNCWFDYIPDTLRNEWASCKAALQELSQSKDPYFALDLAYHQNIPSGGNTTSSLAWHGMVEAVKVLVLHLQLKPFIFGGDPFDNPLISLKRSSLGISGRKYTSDLSSGSFGSELALGSAIPCQIAFSKGGIRDIYIIPISRETSGKLLLLEKHPLHSKRGVVIAVAPLAGLSPKIDENHPAWLHLQIREFDPGFNTSKSKGHHSNTSIHEANSRWTLGFPNTEACEAAQSTIISEINKQRSAVETLLATLLQENFPGSSSDSPQ